LTRGIALTTVYALTCYTVMDAQTTCCCSMVPALFSQQTPQIRPTRQTNWDKNKLTATIGLYWQHMLQH